MGYSIIVKLCALFLIYIGYFVRQKSRFLGLTIKKLYHFYHNDISFFSKIFNKIDIIATGTFLLCQPPP